MDSVAKRCWRSGKLLVVESGTDVSGRCIKCGEPSAKRYDRTLYWHHPVLYALAPLGLLLYALIALAVRKTCKVRVGLCQAHKKKRIIMFAIAWGTFALAIMLFILAAVVPIPRNSDAGVIIALIGVVVLIASGIMGAIVGTSICSPAKITDRYAFIKGAGEEVLIDFAPFPSGS